MAQQIYRQFDFSGGLQTATSNLLRKRNEVVKSINAEYHHKIGAIARRLGYEQVGRTIEHGNDGLGLHIYKYGTNNKILVGINNTNDTAATLRYYGWADYWTDIITDAPLNTRFQMIDFLEEVYVAGASPNNEYFTLTNIDQTLTASTTRNVYKAPRSKFIAEYNGSLYAINCEVEGVKYPDRAYKSSPALGAITFTQTAQVGLLQQLKVDSVRYLKPGMVVDIYKPGTNAKIVDSLTIISVDKAATPNFITFAPTELNVPDNSEVWLEDRKDKLSVVWNTDYPTKESSDFLRVPPGTDEDPAFTGWGKNNNRLFLFTKNSFLKWDGANLITVSPSIGCVSHETIKNIGAWTLWLHTTGVWGYNDSTGQLQLLSRGIDNYIRAINQANFPKASANVVGRLYKLAVGEIAELDSVTTSTSTSSTSTSSTSSSTSSTSTSSTSTSSTSSSTSRSSTSTSSTSSSTSSSSTSSTSTSLSTSSTSTSMSTSSTTTTTTASARKIIRLVYDFDSNAWWAEQHKREIRFQRTHTMHGYTKPYFLDDTGRLFRDEVGNSDHEDTIPMEVQVGRNNFGSEQEKEFVGTYVVAEDARTTQLAASIDGKQFHNIGQATVVNNKIPFPDGARGRDIDYKLTHNDDGERPIIEGIATYFNSTESLYHGRK